MQGPLGVALSAVIDGTVKIPDRDYWRSQINCQSACPVRTDARGYVRAIADGDYERAYYAGLVTERRAKTQLARGTPGAGSVAYEGLRKAMEHYENAESLSPDGDDNAILRWNTCARLIMQSDHLRPEPKDDPSPMLE